MAVDRFKFYSLLKQTKRVSPVICDRQAKSFNDFRDDPLEDLVRYRLFCRGPE